MRWAGQVEYVVERRVALRALGVKPEGKRPLAKPRHRGKGNKKRSSKRAGRLIWLRIGTGGWRL